MGSSYMKLGKSFNPVEHRRFGLGLLAGLLLSVTYLSPSVFYSVPIYDVNLGSPSLGDAHPITPMANNSVMINSTKLEINPRPENATEARILSCEGWSTNTEPCEKGGFIWLNGSLLEKSSSSHVEEEEEMEVVKVLGGRSTESKDVSMTSAEGKYEPTETGNYVMNTSTAQNQFASVKSMEEQFTGSSNQSGLFKGDTMLEEQKSKSEVEGSEPLSDNSSPKPMSFESTSKGVIDNSTFVQKEENSTWQSGMTESAELQNLTLDEPRLNQTETSNIIMVSKNSSIDTIKNISSNQEQVTSSSTLSSNFNNLTGSTLPVYDSFSASAASGSTKKEVAIPTQLLDEKVAALKPKETKPLCDFSNRRSNVCNMQGDIRIHGKSSSVVFMTSTTSPRNESWKIKPYPRKTDLVAMDNVRELTVKSSDTRGESPICTINHNVPAVVFSVGGYVGNYFHSFTDVLVPLFLTSYQFRGEVQFLVTNFHHFWIQKFIPIFNNLSKYPIIDLNNDETVHCFQHAIVGLDSHADMRIDTWRSPNGISMVDFTEFLRKAYSLPRASPITPHDLAHRKRKPRLLIVARSRTRRFTNLEQIIKTARKTGFEVVVAEAGSDIARFAQVVNSCDVMVGVHGAGLTNFVFLPTNATLIQIVPWGNLDWICKTYFGEPSKGMKLKYLEHRIEVEESTLTELYSRDDPVLRAPETIHGWNNVLDLYLTKQNVKLDVKRFRPVLVKALQLLREQ